MRLVKQIFSCHHRVGDGGRKKICFTSRNGLKPHLLWAQRRPCPSVSQRRPSGSMSTGPSRPSRLISLEMLFSHLDHRDVPPLTTKKSFLRSRKDPVVFLIAVSRPFGFIVPYVRCKQRFLHNLGVNLAFLDKKPS